MSAFETGAGPVGATGATGPAGGGSGELLERDIAQTGHGLAVGNVVRHNGTSFVKAQANSETNAEVVGIVSVVADANNFTLHYGGRIIGLAGLTAGTVYFLDDDTAGLLTATEPPDVGDVSKPVLVADSTTSGYFLNFRGQVLSAAGAAQANKYLCYGNTLIGTIASAGGVAEVNKAHGWRVVAEKTGTITAAYLVVQDSSGNIEAGILDTSPTTRNRLWTTGSIACPAANSWASLGNPALAVTAGDSFDFYINADNGTATFGRYVAASGTPLAASMPSDLFTGPLVPGATRNYPLWQRGTALFPMGVTVAESDFSPYVYSYGLVCVIT